MICKQCKTAAPEGARTCPVCGVAMRKPSALRWTMTAVVALLAVAGALYLYFSRTGTEPSDLLDEPTASPAAFTATPHPSAQALAPTAPAASATPPVETTGLIDAGESDELTEADEADPAFVELMAWATAAESYMAGNDDKVFITVNGGLYDMTAESFVTAGELGVEWEFFENPIILYVMSGDFGAIDEALGLAETTDLTVYAAAEVPAGVAVAWSGGYAVIYREEYNGLLRQYGTDHGEISRVSGVPLLSDFLTLAASYTFSEHGYIARYVKADGKYAVAVLTEVGGTDIKAYVYENNEWGWGIAMSELEEAENAALAVNREFPDLNLALLPPYEPSKAQAALYAPQVLEALEAALGTGDEPFLTGEATVSYLSATNGWGYAVVDGSRWLLRLDADGSAEAMAVASWEEAEDLLKSEGREDASFIIWQW